MKVRCVAELSFVLLVELLLTAFICFRATNLAKYPYRLEQREVAAEAYLSDPSSEKEAAYWHELRLAGRHLHRKQLLQAGAIFSVFILLDVIVIYRSNRSREIGMPA
jgi:hypothetical protein